MVSSREKKCIVCARRSAVELEPRVYISKLHAGLRVETRSRRQLDPLTHHPMGSQMACHNYYGQYQLNELKDFAHTWSGDC